MGQEQDRSPSGQQGLCAAGGWLRLKLTPPRGLLVLGCKQSLMQMRWLESSQKGHTEGQGDCASLEEVGSPGCLLRMGTFRKALKRVV